MEAHSSPLVSIVMLLAASSSACSATLPQMGNSAPLRELAQAHYARTTPAVREADLPLRPLQPPLVTVTRSVVAAAAPLHGLPPGSAAPALPLVRTEGSAFGFEGMRAGEGGVGGAVGSEHYVQIAAGLMTIYRKDDGASVLGPVHANSMFTGGSATPAAAACATARTGEASVHFDQLAQRWIILHRAWANGRAATGPYYLCFAVSASADPAGSYHRSALPMQGMYFDDPQLGVWPDAYYVSVNLFDSAAGSPRGPRLCGIDRRALLHGSEARFRCRDLGPDAPALAAVSLLGDAAPPRGAHAGLFVGLGAARDQLLLWRYSFAARRLEGPVAIPVAPFEHACVDGAACIAQPSPGVTLTAVSGRILPQPVYRNDDGRGTLVASHLVRADGGQLAARWYQVGDPFGPARVLQQGSHAADGISRWAASIGIDKAGDIALGYSAGAGDTPAGIRYSGRVRSDPPGRLQTEEVIFNGNGVQTSPAGAPFHSGALALDPVDGCTFWYTQRYVPSSGPANWRTRVARFKFGACG